MRYKLLGPSGLRVSELCLGTMSFGDAWGFGADEKHSHQILDAFADAGGNFIDTANKYHEGQSEEILGGFLGPDRDRFVVATKYTLAMGSGREGHLCRPVRRPGLGRVSSQHGGGPSRLEPVRCSAGRVQPARAHRRGGAAAGGRGLRPLGLCLGADGCRDPHRQVHRRHLDIPDRSWCLWQDSNLQPAV
jgi:hypothetical protein